MMEEQHRKGIVSMEMVGDGYKSLGNLIVLKSGIHAKRGFVINFCPFCGER